MDMEQAQLMFLTIVFAHPLDPANIACPSLTTPLLQGVVFGSMALFLEMQQDDVEQAPPTKSAIKGKQAVKRF